MDSNRFGTLSTRLAAPATRRRTLGLLGLMAVAGAKFVEDAAARKHRKNRKDRKNKCSPPRKRSGI